jgi:hypothetical protein
MGGLLKKGNQWIEKVKQCSSLRLSLVIRNIIRAQVRYVYKLAYNVRPITLHHLYR